MIFETLISGLGGGILRLVPEALKWLDRKDERKHELDMMQKEMDFSKLRGEISMHQTEAAISVAELDAIKSAVEEQGKTAQSAGWFVAAASALVRPIITYWFTALYTAAKVCSMVLAMDQAASWKEVFVNSWTTGDMQIFSMLLGFWFIGRVWDKTQDKK